MRKLFYLFLMLGVVAVSCKKPADIPTAQDVVFKATLAATGNFKDGETPECVNEMAHYAIIDIDGTMHTVDVFYLNGVIYTNTLKLDPGTYSVESFVLMNDNNTPLVNGVDVDADDYIVQAAPLTGSDYATWVTTSLPATFTVNAFFKVEVPLSTLCFVPNDYTSFGFAWFTVEEVMVREVCFFGDFCTKYFEDYGQSLYASQVNGLRHDMPAIFKIDVYRNNEWVISYNNAGWFGEGAPLCVKYPDFKGSVDTFKFKLSILVKVGDGFEYKEFHTFTTVDAEPLANIGDDNIMDFVLGSCVTDADLVLAPYMNLPATAKMYVGTTYAPGTQGMYLDITLSGIGTGFDIGNGIHGANCADKHTNIYTNATYNVSVHSSLYPDLLPGGADEFADNFDNINWLRNNLYRYPAQTWADRQNVMWGLNNQLTMTVGAATDFGALTQTAVDMYNDAVEYGDGFMPPVGGWAAVIFLSPAFNEGAPSVQLLFTMVDP